jgi:hypothetical protein
MSVVSVPPPSPSPAADFASGARVLILARDAEQARRLRTRCESLGYQAVAADARESPTGVLLRERPVCVVVDRWHPAADSPEFAGHAADLHAHVVRLDDRGPASPRGGGSGRVRGRAAPARTAEATAPLLHLLGLTEEGLTAFLTEVPGARPPVRDADGAARAPRPDWSWHQVTVDGIFYSVSTLPDQPVGRAGPKWHVGYNGEWHELCPVEGDEADRRDWSRVDALVERWVRRRFQSRLQRRGARE